MKVLVCASEYYPYGSGIANVAYNVVEQLKKKGVNCTVCSPTGPDIPIGNTKLIKAYGIFGLIYYWYKVSRYFKNNKECFDAVWLHNPLFFKNCPFSQYIVTMNSTYYGKVIHGKFPWYFHLYYIFSYLLEKYSLTSLKSNVHFTAVGKNVFNELESLGISKNRITYIPNGVNTELFKHLPEKEKLRDSFGIDKDNIVLLSVGRLSEVKQPLLLLEVFSLIEKDIQNISLVIGGDGELLSKAKDFVDHNKLRNVLFLGHVNYIKDLPSLYSCSDYFIMTSSYEGGEPPLTLSEAMSSNLRCIVSDIPNFSIVKQACCGIIVNFSDIQEAAKRIIKYIHENNYQHSENAREYIVKNLDWEILSKIYFNEFKIIQGDL